MFVYEPADYITLIGKTSYVSNSQMVQCEFVCNYHKRLCFNLNRQSLLLTLLSAMNAKALAKSRGSITYFYKLHRLTHVNFIAALLCCGIIIYNNSNRNKRNDL